MLLHWTSGERHVHHSGESRVRQNQTANWPLAHRGKIVASKSIVRQRSTGLRFDEYSVNQFRLFRESLAQSIFCIPITVCI
ncbi:MAG: hypothetical protein DWI02_04070 [Planctomycetota bacterium]|nr:MAG: hypothetical protein DWI02_04070 [Planctomycetota bacterium]